MLLSYEAKKSIVHLIGELLRNTTNWGSGKDHCTKSATDNIIVIDLGPTIKKSWDNRNNVPIFQSYLTQCAFNCSQTARTNCVEISLHGIYTEAWPDESRRNFGATLKVLADWKW